LFALDLPVVARCSDHATAFAFANCFKW
jgi:hypothetical protein